MTVVGTDSVKSASEQRGEQNRAPFAVLKLTSCSLALFTQTNLAPALPYEAVR